MIRLGTCLPCRYILTFLGFLGFIFNYCLRVNINLLILSMTVPEPKEGEEEPENSENLFQWDTSTKNAVIGNFYIGYMILQIPGGRVAELIGGKKVLGLALGLTAVLTMLIPTAAKLGGTGPDDYPYYLVVLRVVMGLCEGVTFPAMSCMLARWAPVSERAKMSTLVLAGSQVGTIVGFFLSGILADALSWEAAFYIEGGACFVWLGLWMVLVYDTPEDHPFISPAELQYIQAGRPSIQKTSLPIPWLALFTSLPFWAIVVGNFSNNWGFHLLMTELPQYLRDVFPEYMEKSTVVGLWAALPYACMWISSLLCSYISDLIIRRKIVTVATSRKLFNTLSQTGPAICLLALLLSVSKENPNLELTLGLFTTAVSLEGGLYSGFLVNPQDIAPNFAGTVLGFSNAFGSIPGFVAPAIAGLLVNEASNDPSTWKPVWIIAVCILFCASVFFAVFADGVPQSWNYATSPDLEESRTEKEKKKEEVFLNLETMQLS